MIIDFKEIPQANTGEGNQDTFEMFARDFFKLQGYEIIDSPSRGADGGIDLKIKEVRKGPLGETEYNWLVSCKHYSHSCKSISSTIEQDILDRVESNGCDGFIGFYSTITTSGLTDKLKGLSEKISYHIFDHESIEERIVGIPDMENLFVRYFPESFKKWSEIYYYQEPVKLFEKYLFNNHLFTMDVYKFYFFNTGFLIKQLKVSKSFKDLFEKNSISVKVVDFSLLKTWIDIPKPFKDFDFNNDQFWSFFETNFPLKLKIQWGLVVKCNGSIEIGPSFISIYDGNQIVLEKTQADKLETAFWEMKDILS